MRGKGINSVLFISQLIITDMISFPYRAIYNIIYRDPTVPTMSKHLAAVARKKFDTEVTLRRNHFRPQPDGLQ